jgi:hypothetical protein
VRHAVSRATFGVEGDVRCRGRRSVSRATCRVRGWRATVEGDVRCRVRQSKSGLEGHCRGRRSVSRTTIKVGSDIACRSQAEPCPPPRKHIPLMTINTVLANMSCPREGGKWKESSFLLSTMNVTTEALTRPLRSIPNLQQVGISSSFALSVRGHFTLCGEPLPAKPGTFSWSILNYLF